MTVTLHPEVATSVRPFAVRGIAAGLACGFVGASIALLVAPQPVAVPAVVSIEMHEEPSTSTMPIAARAEPAPVDGIQLVFHAGGTAYMKLADAGDANIAYGDPKLHEDEWVYSAVAPIRAQDVPAAHRHWLGKQVIVDGGCRATVTEIAVVSRLTGDTAYAGVDIGQWTPPTVMQHGARVIAARLDRACSGAYARDAALPAIAKLETVAGAPAELVTRVRDAFVASHAGKAAEKVWREFEQEGRWYEVKDTTIVLETVRHPTTGATWVYIHAHNIAGCGGPSINAWGLYRVNADGTITAVQLVDEFSIEHVEALIDVDGDGTPEVLGGAAPGVEQTLVGGKHDVLDQLAVTFYGCSC